MTAKLEKETSLIVNPIEFGIEESKATTIEQAFAPKVIERDGFLQIYENILTKEITESVCKEAGDLRKKLVKVRTGIADIHKTEKAFYLASGRYVDALKNKLTLPIEQMEEKLAEVEKYYELQEKQRIANLEKERLELLKPYEVFNAENMALGLMPEDIWNNFFTGSKSAYEARKEAERKAEEERIAREKAEAERIEAQRIENERLKAEAEAREREIEAERKKQEEILAKQKAEADNKLKEEQEKARIEKEKAEAEAKRIQEENARKLEAERKERERIEAELKAKQAEEERIRKEKEAAELQAKKEAEKLAKAPIKKQVKIWVESFSIPVTPVENPTTKVIQAKFEAFQKWALEQVESI